VISHINQHPGVRWVTFEEIADDFKARYPRGSGNKPESAIDAWPPR